MSPAQRAQLQHGMEALGLTIDTDTEACLSAFVDELEKWNRTYNMVSAAGLEDVVTRHLLDSFSILPFIQGKHLLDVGSGAGFPGIPLAIVQPALHCTVLDSAGKKVRFMRHVQRMLKLDNVQPVEMRVEAFTMPEPPDVIVSRAFSSLVDFVTAVQHLTGPQTRLLAMKGKYPHAELTDLPDRVRVDAIEPIRVPGLQAERHLVMMSLSPESAGPTEAS